MTPVRQYVQRSKVCLLALSLLVSNIPSVMAQALDSSVDFEAPVIDHEPPGNGVHGEIQVFTATVADNVALSSVSLFYRFENDENYQLAEMEQLAQAAFYTASIPTKEIQANQIEYYFKAEDAAGNIVLKGQPFEPLTSDSSSRQNTCGSG